MGEGGYSALGWGKASQVECDCGWGCNPCGPGDMVKDLSYSQAGLGCHVLGSGGTNILGPTISDTAFLPVAGFSSNCSLCTCHSNE